MLDAFLPPFNATIKNSKREARYAQLFMTVCIKNALIRTGKMASFIRNFLFYSIKPLLPRFLQLYLRRVVARHKRKKYKNVWPILQRAGVKPNGWHGWPEEKKFALVLNHDVDTQRGHDKCRLLAALETELGVRSLFNFVPERYNVSRSLQQELAANGFEIGVHGLKHDGKLFRSRKIFSRSAEKINKYIGQWEVNGFSSPSMMHNLSWMHALDIEWDISTFDTDPFEPQPDGVETIFPFVVEKKGHFNPFIELPYTMPQDFTLYILMQEKDISIWKKKLDWIADKGGMALVNSHPDYMHFGDGKLEPEEYHSAFYREFVEYALNKYEDRFWRALPHDIVKFAKSNSSNFPTTWVS